MKILVTGSSGFIGKHLVNRLLQEEEKHEIVGVSRRSHNHFLDMLPTAVAGYREFHCNLEMESHVYNFFQKFRPDVIFHLAANPLVKEDGANPCGITHTNVAATHYLLAHCPPGTRFVYASSATVYGTSHETFYPATEKAETKPASIYGVTKLASEHYVRVYAKRQKVNPLILRLAANVGGGASHGVLPDLIRKLGSKDPFLNILGTQPGSVKPYCHVTDTAEAMVKLGLNLHISETLNLATKYSISIEALARVMMGAVNVVKPLLWEGKATTWAGDDNFVTVATFNAGLLGWNPKYKTSEAAVAQASVELWNQGA